MGSPGVNKAPHPFLGENKWETFSCLLADSRVVQQQDDGVQLLPGPVIRPERHDEVVEAVAGSLGRHDDELVLEAVGLGVLEAVVPAALGKRGDKGRGGRGGLLLQRGQTEAAGDSRGSGRAVPTWSRRRQQNGAFSASRWHRVGELPM